MVGCVAWNDEIPIYATAPGVVLDKHSLGAANQPGAQAALFFSADQLPQLRVGQQALVHIGASKEELASKVIKVEPAVVSPSVIHQRYGFMAQIVTQPSIVVLIQIDRIPASTFGGSVLVANVKTGSQRILSMLPGLGSLMRG
ncbi:hypothetical protein [Dictyobacter aurantiacus]|uniref:RND efflux pump membrane fusion protein barrel-sandwich domain-containing protein n=1 Tax=Dictyobacter aurantiacus TaxID=1936993 RepID=A0A401ZQ94_9CHLR|nr:hypothetical protein [Dictyobacter aurantiacus]GCE09053.1 hypothetical protein KDAU_63820 [Dictyobacter aurantiacus]